MIVQDIKNGIRITTIYKELLRIMNWQDKQNMQEIRK